ncbi:hypothetical protein GUJ93_ZPchr0006g43293 [Zizania palustris]|uniref:Uncharacterized protein n=1 Tax=Zizania palustris TaxID=103762 RepID=A0A8J5W3C9_ZIZPA|nr:hypothetical protein GUJ93_ZPchr0006g43293 [Zizania palustris]
MGNCCLNPASKVRHHHHAMAAMPPAPEEESKVKGSCGLHEATMIGHVLREQEEGPQRAVQAAAAAAAAAGVKVKVVLTRAELEWLMAQLNTGDRRLEDVLHQMGTARTAAARPPPPPRSASDGSWRPRLECILECQEPAAT